MTPTGSSDEEAKRLRRLERSVNTEQVILDGFSRSPEAERLKNIQTGTLNDLTALRESGDIRAIIRYELACLNAELTKFASDKDHRSSLETGIMQLTVFDQKIDHVRDHEAYRLYDRQHVLLDTNRSGGVPIDEAWQCYKSHRTRLDNTRRTRMGDGERLILEERRKNFNRAFELYKGLQREALGLAKDAEKEQGMSLGPQL